MESIGVDDASANQYGSLSNFEIGKKVGKGQFSEVYRARCVVDGKLVALKKVQIFEMMDAKARQVTALHSKNHFQRKIKCLTINFLDCMSYILYPRRWHGQNNKP